MNHPPSEAVASSECGEIVVIPDKAMSTGLAIFPTGEKDKKTCLQGLAVKERRIN